jgi:alpha-tubulin suppressor-like RCC1 family protein
VSFLPDTLAFLTFILGTGNLYLWGSGKNYKLGNQWKDDVWDYKNGLLDFCDHEGIVQIACGYDFSGFLDKSGSIYMWGGNYFGQLGLGDQNIRSRPTRVNTFRDNVKVESIDFGAFHCVCASSEGEVYSWGFNNMGQLGNGTCLNQMQPKLIYRLNGKKVKRIMCSGSSSIFLTGRLPFLLLRNVSKHYHNSICL